MKIIKNRKIVIIALILLLLLLGIIGVIKYKINHTLSNLEKIKIVEMSDEYIPFITELNASEFEKYDDYVSFFLNYSLNKENKTELSVSEIKNLTKKVFGIELDEIKLKDMGISPFLHERNIDYDYIESKYIISEVKLSNLDIKEVPLVKFILNDVNKNGNKYVVTYDNYTIEDPYKLLDYYNSTEGEHDDTSKILSYLSGNERKQTIIDLLNKDILTNADALKEELKVDYFINDNDFIIKTVSKK